MKKFLCALLLITLCLASCSKKSEYRDDIPCDSLAQSLAELCSVDGGYSEYGGEQIKYFFEDTRLPDDYALLYSVEAEDINEIGIFHCPDAKSTLEMLEITENYIENMQETQVNFVSSYAPYEIPKLEGAEVKQYGNYIIYVILDTAERRTVFSTAEEELTNN